MSRFRAGRPRWRPRALTDGPRDRLGRRREIVHELAAQLALLAGDPRYQARVTVWSLEWRVTAREMAAAARLARVLLSRLDAIARLAEAGEGEAAQRATERLAQRIARW